MLVIAIVPTYQLPPGDCSPARGAQGLVLHQDILLQEHIRPGSYSTPVTGIHSPSPNKQIVF